MIPSPANPFYLTLDVGQLTERCGMSTSTLAAYLLEKHQVRVFPGEHPKASLAHGVVDADETCTEPLVYARGFVTERRSLLRLSFGMETRLPEAAQALRRGFAALQNS